MLSNVVAIIGCGMTLFPNIKVLLAGRFIYGVACGAFSVVCPKYIIEIAPVEISGPAASMTQIAVTFGILVPFILSSIFPDNSDIEKDKLLIQIVFLLPMILAGLHILIQIFIFKHDTPLYLKEKGDMSGLRKSMKALYKPSEITTRIN